VLTATATASASPAPSSLYSSDHIIDDMPIDPTLGYEDQLYRFLERPRIDRSCCCFSCDGMCLGIICKTAGGYGKCCYTLSCSGCFCNNTIGTKSSPRCRSICGFLFPLWLLLALMLMFLDGFLLLIFVLALCPLFCCALCYVVCC